MAYIRKRLGKWQSVVRVKGYPANSFNIFRTKLLATGVGYLYSLDYLLLINLR